MYTVLVKSAMIVHTYRIKYFSGLYISLPCNGLSFVYLSLHYLWTQPVLHLLHHGTAVCPPPPPPLRKSSLFWILAQFWLQYTQPSLTPKDFVATSYTNLRFPNFP